MALAIGRAPCVDNGGGHPTGAGHERLGTPDIAVSLEWIDDPTHVPINTLARVGLTATARPSSSSVRQAVEEHDRRT